MYDIFRYKLPLMPTERKSIMISARVPLDLVARVDFIVRNTEGKATKNRSAAVLTALEAWLPEQEQRLVELGVITKKALYG